jgi:hypothetical protein
MMSISLCQQEYPLSYLDEQNNPKGVVFDFVNILQDKYGFNYKVKRAEQNIIGDADTGIISMVYKKVSTTKGVHFMKTKAVGTLHRTDW